VWSSLHTEASIPSERKRRKRAEYSAVYVLATGLPTAFRPRQTVRVRVLTASACVALAFLGVSAQASTVRAPVLRLVDIAPVTFRGTGFARLERVRVTLTRNGRTTTRSARANNAGAFRVGFGLVALDPCLGAIVVRATGARGSRATFRRACQAPRP
jgi:hypothetical protein